MVVRVAIPPDSLGLLFLDCFVYFICFVRFVLFHWLIAVRFLVCSALVSSYGRMCCGLVCNMLWGFGFFYFCLGLLVMFLIL